jgi:hypothetical protein
MSFLKNTFFDACKIDVLCSRNKGRVHAKVGSKLVNLNVDYNYLLEKVEIALVILIEELKSNNFVNLMSLRISKGELSHKSQGDLPIIFRIHSIKFQRI